MVDLVELIPNLQDYVVPTTIAMMMAKDLHCPLLQEARAHRLALQRRCSVIRFEAVFLSDMGKSTK